MGHVFGSILKSLPFLTALDPKDCIQMNFGKINSINHSELGKICLRSAEDYSFSSHFFFISGQNWLFSLIFGTYKFQNQLKKYFRKVLSASGPG